MENALLYETLKYDHFLKKILQKKIILVLDGKIIKSGELLLYSYKNFSIQFLFRNTKTGKPRKTEIPIPFRVENTNSKDLLFSYELDTICSDSDLYKTTNKFFNKNLIIKIQE
jgi:hypothetical protein